MKKSCFRFLLALLLMAALLPASVLAAEPTDPSRLGSITLEYSLNDTAYPGMEIRIYRVADIAPDGGIDLTESFAGYPVNIHGITSQKEWQDTASTLASYIAADALEPTRTALTDENGEAVFTELPVGVYLIFGVTAEDDLGTSQFENFFIFLPTAQEDGVQSYGLTAAPKGVFTPKPQEPEEVSYQVVKLWKDTGNRSKRPVSITVDLLKDRQVQQTVTLNAANNWSYQWTGLEADGQWSVVERDVPDEYKVVITENGTVFQITNTYVEPSEIPKTGDTAAVWVYILAMCLSGIGLLMVGLYAKRRSGSEKKQ